MINDKYIIKKKLGSGRSVVYLCENKNLPGKDLAIKILSKQADKEEVRFFKNEYLILQKLNHPNIVKSFEFGTVLRIDNSDFEIEAGCKFFTLELCSGIQLINSSEIREEKKIKKIITQLCSILFYLHQSNYIYYDLKAENILVTFHNEEPIIKLIDLGLAQHVVSDKNEVKRGTPEYIAPEILKNLAHDFRVDFYSLGVLLYQLIYRKFPFSATNELEIYKAHIEKEFAFPHCDYSEKLISVVKKLLKKSPSDRYNNTIQILSDLQIPIAEDLYKDWLPAKTFADRRDFINILKTYINDQTSSEVFVLHGAEGAGKTAIVYQIYSLFDDVVLIDNTNSLAGIDFIKDIIKNVIYSEIIYSKLSPEIFSDITTLLSNSTVDLNNEIKGVFSRIASLTPFTIIFDGFNNYDELTIEILKGIIPIFQVNKVKVILTENSDKQLASGFINNIRILDLTPFIEANLVEYLDMSFSQLFPKDDLKKLILAYADLLPGSLESFIKDLIMLKVLQFTPGGIVIRIEDSSEKYLRSSHEEIYSMRLQKLNTSELELVHLLSSFEITLDDEVVKKIIPLSSGDLENIYSGLAQKNILHKRRNKENPVFTSEGLKKHIYLSREENAGYHEKIAHQLKENFPDFNRNELARQFELAQKYDESYFALKEETIEAKKQSAFSYEKGILMHMLSLPLDNRHIQKTKYELCRVYYKLGEYLPLNLLLDELLEQRQDEDVKTELIILKGYCLIGLGDYVEGKTLLENILKGNHSHDKYFQILIKIATAEFNLNEFEESSTKCREVINNKLCLHTEKASSFEILGLNFVQNGFKLKEALECFEHASQFFSEDNEKTSVAEMQMNIANVYYYSGDSQKAQYYLNQSLEIHKKTGNIEQHAKILGNFGLLYFEKSNFSMAIKYYNEALQMLTTIGDKKSFGVVLGVLGEVYLLNGQYQKSYDYLKESMDVFKVQQNLGKELDASFNLGKLFFAIGDYESAKKVIFEYSIGKMNSSLNGEYGTLFNVLILLISINDGVALLNASEIRKLGSSVLSYNRLYDYLFLYLNAILHYIKTGLFELSHKLLFNDEFENICKGNLYAYAERNYLLGVLSSSTGSYDKLEPAIDYFQKAYKSLQDLDVSELTWKVLYQLAVFYVNRGQVSKAKEYAEDGLSLINYFADNIREPFLKKAFLNEPERKTAIEKLKKIVS